MVKVKSGSDYEIYAKEGYGPDSPAVKVEWGFSTDNNVGSHNHLNTFAVAILGKLDEYEEFTYAAWTDEDYGKEIFTKSVLGQPKECDGWTPDGEEVDWEAYHRWIESYCKMVL